MVQDQLIEYVKTTLAQGHSEVKIRKALKQAGYPLEDIDHAVEVARLAEAVPEEEEQTESISPDMEKPEFEPGKKGYFTRLKTVLLKPQQFFEEIEHEEGYKWPILFLSITLLFQFALFSIFFMLFAKLISASLPEISYVIAAIPLSSLLAIFFAFFVIGGMIASFVIAGLVWLFTKFIGYKLSYADSYKTVSYAHAPMLPGLALMVVPVLGQVATVAWHVLIFVFGLSQLSKMSKGKAGLVVLLLFLLGVLVSLILGVLGAI